MLSQKPKPIQNTFKTQLSIPDEDTSSKLSQRIFQISEEYEKSYQNYILETTQSSKVSSANKILMSTELNKLIFKNSEKQRQIEDLKQEIRALSGPSLRVQYEEKIRLEKRLSISMKSLEESEKEQNSIKNLLNREKQAILSVKEKVIKLADDHRKITKSHTEVYFAKDRASYNLKLVENEIVREKHEEAKSSRVFSECLKVKKKIRDDYQRDKDRIIEEISVKAIKIEENEIKNNKNREELQKNFKSIEESQSKKNQYLFHLHDYNQQIKKINSIIKKFDMETISPPESPHSNTWEQLENIIKAYCHLKYKGESLSMQFSILTSENIQKTKELLKYQNKLRKLKKENKDLLNTPQGSSVSTFNLTKTKIEDNEIITSKQEDYQKSEGVVIKSFFEVILILEKSFRKLEEGLSPKPEDKSYDKYIKSQILALESLKKEVFGENIELKEDKKNPRREGYDKRSSFTVANYRLSALEKEKFGVINYREFEKFEKTLKKQSLLRFFISKEEIVKFFKTFTTPKDLYLNIDSFYNTAHSRFKVIFTRFLTLLNDLIVKTKSELILERKGKFLFFSQNSISKDYFLKVSKRTSFKYPYRGAKSKTDFEEEPDREMSNLEQVNLKEDKSNESVKSKKKFEMESPHSILKEVLKFERDIKDLKFKDRLASNRSNLGKGVIRNNLNKPWVMRTPRNKSENKKEDESAKSLKKLYSPQGVKFELKANN